MRLKVGTATIIAVLATSLPTAAIAVPARLPDSVSLPQGLQETAGHDRRRRDWDRNDGVDAGDVIAGVAVLGAIAAIAGVFDGDRNEPRRIPADARREGAGERGGLGRAVDMCVAEMERGGARVDSVEDATRDASGWRVSGVLAGGERFDCRIGNDGRVRGVDSATRYDAALPQGDGAQYSDAVYARVRAGQDTDPAAEPYAPAGDGAYGDEPRPAYPGGPLPGEEGYEDYAAPDQVVYRGN